MNDHHRIAGNQSAGQNPAYALLFSLRLNKNALCGKFSRGRFCWFGKFKLFSYA
jgi:hypothetical protein